MPRGIKEDVMNALRRAQTVGLARVNPHTGYAAFLPGSSESEAPSSDQPEANTEAQSEGPPPGQPQASTEVSLQSSGQDQVESQPTHDSIEKNQPMGQTT